MRCGATLGFLPDRMELSAIEPDADGQWRSPNADRRYRMCANYSNHAACNWMLDAASEQAFCIACSLNGTIPDLSVEGNRGLWHTMEAEKRQLIYSILRLGLPFTSRQQDSSGLEFDFLADTASSFSERGRVFTGHADDDSLDVRHDFDAYREASFDTIIEHWLPLTFALNSFNRSMGHAHAYPFVLSPAAVEKLRFAHRVVTG